VADQTIAAPVARSPIRPAGPVRVSDGWEVSGRGSTAALRLADRSPLSKVLVRAAAGGAVQAGLGVGFGRALRRADGVLVIGSGPGEWLLLGAPNRAAELAGSVPADGERLVSTVDVTHGRALVRLTGDQAPAMLAKVCAIDLRDAATPDGRAFRSSVVKVVTDVVRDDADGVRSYLLHCERSSGQYFFDALLDAGAEFDLEVDGFEPR
jgi:heterotetrameric sarcosine oxidase gamma subunit